MLLFGKRTEPIINLEVVHDFVEQFFSMLSAIFRGPLKSVTAHCRRRCYTEKMNLHLVSVRRSLRSGLSPQVEENGGVFGSDGDIKKHLFDLGDDGVTVTAESERDADLISD